ncbi:hypothetical protein CFP56_035464 [Quercus suber]|uniref:Secreted protein n=1 Tax=Quercus suber TaxID=58331 RepID=A0AAW0LRC5_QUESU
MLMETCPVMMVSFVWFCFAFYGSMASDNFFLYCNDPYMMNRNDGRDCHCHGVTATENFHLLFQQAIIRVSPVKEAKAKAGFVLLLSKMLKQSRKYVLSKPFDMPSIFNNPRS